MWFIENCLQEKGCMWYHKLIAKQKNYLHGSYYCIKGHKNHPETEDFMKCIYCLEDKQSNYFKNREHVLPESFGSFKNNFTLKNMVCDVCNVFLGIILRYI